MDINPYETVLKLNLGKLTFDTYRTQKHQCGWAVYHVYDPIWYI